MATIVKEKREKKKKHKTAIPELGPPPSLTDLATLQSEFVTKIDISSKEIDNEEVAVEEEEEEDKQLNTTSEAKITDEINKIELDNEKITSKQTEENQTKVPIEKEDNDKNDIKIEELYPKLEFTEDTEAAMSSQPSAPLMVEPKLILPKTKTVIKDQVLVKQPCMSLKEAERLFCGSEIAQIKALSEREALAVDRSSIVSSDHPLVDLLSTFRQSLKAVERVRTELSRNYIEEEKFRNELWKVEKRTVTASDRCRVCGRNVQYKASYEHAALLRDRLPVARMKLEAVSRDVQESYCHYLHAVLLAHCQIEEFIYETLHTTNSQVRTALSLILEALRTSDSTPSVIAEALQRWATALVAGLLKGGHIADLLFLWHLLFRQNRSVSWAARIMCVSVREMVEVARSVALLDILMTSRTPLEVAVECAEDNLNVWEEIDEKGAGSAVTSDALRERDILAILNAIPFREIVARLALIRHQNIEDCKDYEWGDGSGGRGVMKAICGVRVLLAALHRGVTSLPTYHKMAERVVELAAQCLNALADLQEHCRSTLAPELRDKISAELEAAFSKGWVIAVSTNSSVYDFPFSLLSFGTAKAYAEALIKSLHGKTSTPIDGEVVVPVALSCSTKIKVLSQIAVKRNSDHELAKFVFNFFLEEAFTSKASCVENCRSVILSVLSQILGAHKYLYYEAVCTFVTYRLESEIVASDLEYLSLVEWIPRLEEITAALWHTAKMNSTLLPSILLSFDYTIHSGLPFEIQYAIALFLCQWVKQSHQAPTEWSWQVLRRLRLHPVDWHAADAPNPLEEPYDLFSSMFTLLTTSWGNSVPLICENGVNILCKLSAGGRIREAIHCLSYITRVMAGSPESILFTKQFSELCNSIIDIRPSTIQRVFGLGGDNGHSLLLTLLIEQLHTKRRPEDNILKLLSSWVYLCCDHPQLVEAAMVCCYDCPELDHFITIMLQDETLLKKLTNAPANVAATLCLHILSNTHVQQELQTGIWLKLLDALDGQRTQKIHVDRALQSIGASVRSDDLMIHKTAGAVLVAPLHHPAHLLLWRLFFYLYVQTATANDKPVGPLFFEGIIKSRTLAHLQKKLQEALNYHKSEVEKLKVTSQATCDGGMEKTSVEKSQKTMKTFDLLPPLSLVDIIGDNVDRSDETEVSSDDASCCTVADVKVVVDSDFIRSYHKGAVRLCHQYLRWLEAGRKIIVSPNEGDLSLYISRDAINSSWKIHAKTIIPNNSEEILEPKRKLTEPIRPPLDRLLTRLRNYRVRNHRAHRPLVLRLPLKKVPKDARALVKYVDEIFKNINKLSKSWEERCERVKKLDRMLWDLVVTLRVRRAFSPISLPCPNSCSHVTLVLPGEEWCLSLVSVTGIKKNRSDALGLIRQLACPEPKIANLMASLQTVARYVNDVNTAITVVERVMNNAQDCIQLYPPARDALTSLAIHVAQRHISSNGIVCEQLAERWYNTNLNTMQQSISCTVISPTLLPKQHISLVYCAILKASLLPPDIVFSQLSKFEISKWCNEANVEERNSMLWKLLERINELGNSPPKQYDIILELLCVHMSLLISSRDLYSVICHCATASVSATLPVVVWHHLCKVAAERAALLSSEEIMNIFSSFGNIWRDLNQNPKSDFRPNQPVYEKYSTDIAVLLQILTRALVEVNKVNIYYNRNVIINIWNSICSSWTPWLWTPKEPIPPILEKEQSRNDMLLMFLESVNDLILKIPGCEAYLLQKLFELCSHECFSDKYLTNIKERLPWNRVQWFHFQCYHSARKLCSSGKRQKVFFRSVTRCLKAESWLGGVSEKDISPYLAGLLSLFTRADLHEETIKEITALPWDRLPLVALDAELRRFFSENHSKNVLCHTFPSFSIILSASEMLPRDSAKGTTTAHEKCLALTSYWVRSISDTRADDVYKNTMAAILNVIQNRYKHSESSQDVQSELGALLSCAMGALGIEPAASAVLAVWQERVSNARPLFVVSSVRAVITLSVFSYFADLSECILKAYFKIPGSNWQYIQKFWCQCFWREAELIERCSFLSAYAFCTLPNYERGELFRITLLTLLSKDIDFIEQESSIALWICLASRLSSLEKSEVSETCEVRAGITDVAVRVLRAWGKERKLSIIKVITLSKQNNDPTPRLRLLARLALCMVQPNEAAIKAYESTHATVFGPNPATDTITWARTANLKHLPMLAAKLYPDAEQIFSLELASYS